jgi:catechol 2,3-dioxygenase-like lactoylglutathione lyase family enzyme
MIAGSCHCGAVQIDLETAPAQVTDCNCTMCRRIGGLWAYYSPKAVRIGGTPEATFTYVHGDRTLAVHHCRTCGCTTHWTATDPAYDRMGVNARMLAPEVLAEAYVRHLDGADTWTYGEDNLRQVTPFIYVRDLAAAVRWFDEALGFSCGHQDSVYAYVSREPIAFRLLRRDELPPGQRRYASYIDVRDLDALYAELKPRLDKLPAGDVEGPYTTEYGQRELAVLAPDGDLIVFGQGVD